MPIGPKTRRYLDSKRDPSESVTAFMRSMETMAEETAHRVIQEYILKIKGEPGKDGRDGAPGRNGKDIKGKDGKDGRDGKDGNPGKDGVDGISGYTPISDVDYPSVQAMHGMVEEMMKTMQERMKKEGMMKMDKAMKAMCEKEMNPEKIARALETLHNAERLDYEALKNRPGVPVEGPQRHTLHRGGPGKQTYYYDLSDLCNGVDKTFAIPVNTRVVAVSGTDAPGGIYRPLVDWTGSGTLLLTLTAEVAAPTAGATLYILYVQ